MLRCWSDTPYTTLYLCTFVVILATSATDQSPFLVSGDISKMDGKLGGSAHKFRSISTDRNEARDGCPRACGLPFMKASTRLILSSDRESCAYIQARYTSKWTHLPDLILISMML